MSAFVVGSVAVSSAAFGYWSKSGSGFGSASVATTPVVTLTPGTGQADLLPGGSGTVVTAASNPTSTAAHVTSLTLDTSRGTNGFAVDSGHSGCDTSVLGFSTQTKSGSGWDVAANTTTTISVPASITMTTAAVAACQGATITVYLGASQ